MNAVVDKLKARFAESPRKSRVGPIGLHFAEEQVHAVQLRRTSAGQYCLRAWSSASYLDTREDALESPARLQRLLGNLLGRAAFRGRHVVTALPPAMVRINSLNYQLQGPAGDGETILRLMDERLDGGAANYVLDYLPVRSESTRDRVALVTASRKSDVLAFLENLRAAGVEVDELEVSPAAVNRLIGLLPKPEGARGNVLIVNYGAESSYLTLISGRRLLMDKEISFGANVVIRQIAKSLDTTLEMAEEMAVRQGLAQQTSRPFGATQQITEDDLNPVTEIVRPVFAPLAEEVRRACLYAASESQGEVVEHVYTLGSIARWPGAGELLAEVAKLPVSTTLPVTAIFDSDNDAGIDEYAGVGPDLAVATGLALRGLTDDA